MDKQAFSSLRRARKWKIALSVFIGLTCASLILTLSASPANEKYSFESGADIDIDRARSTYQSSGSGADLYVLLIGLCRQVYIGGSAVDTQELCFYGRELYARAKASELDLETIGNTADTMAMLGLLNELGVTVTTS